MALGGSPGIVVKDKDSRGLEFKSWPQMLMVIVVKIRLFIERDQK